MDDYLPNVEAAAKYRARKIAAEKSKKIALQINDEIIPISEFYQSGFSINKKYALPKRAHVEIVDGAKPLFSGLIQLASDERELQHYEFKRVSPITGQAPLDYAPAHEHGDDDVYLAGLITER